MLLKCTASEKRARTGGVPAKGKSGRGAAMKMTMSTGSTMTPRIHRKVMRVASKRYPGKVNPGKLNPGKLNPGKLGGKLARTVRPVDPCDNSNDSGFGFEQHLEFQLAARNRLAAENTEASWRDERQDEKRRKLDIRMESDDSNANFTFPVVDTAVQKTMTRVPLATTMPMQARAMPRLNMARRSPIVQGPITLTSQLSSISRDGKVQLQILCQPEQQHRARYQTEGSRGAVKDRNGNGFPIVKLVGYEKPAVLQVFIGTDMGRVAPHMFYQACRVSGKNSTPCSERKVEGTIVIEVQLESVKDMTVTCDCVGILKERNVDVEHRFPEQTGPRSKKKSTRCRMVFRTMITNDDNTTETLQVCSQQIVCTQPPGVPEICKKSLTSCPATGGLELFILGKNFLKDTRVVFQQCAGIDGDGEVVWEDAVAPDKEFMQQTHLVCTVPSYHRSDIPDSVHVRLFVVSSGKTSEPHPFMFTPPGARNPCPLASATTTSHTGMMNETVTRIGGHFMSEEHPRPIMMWASSELKPKPELDMDMMPPPAPVMPLTARRQSGTSVILPDQLAPPILKSEVMDDCSQHSESVYINENSMDNSMDSLSMMRHARRMRKRERVQSESSLDICENSNMSMICNDNSMDSMTRRRNSFIHHSEDSMSQQMPLMMRTPMMSDSQNSSDVMLNVGQLSPQEVMDLRIKPNDFNPSMRTFVMPDSRNVMLQSQADHSVGKFLSNLENDVTKSMQMQGLQNNMTDSQTNITRTDKMIESVAAAMFNTQPVQTSPEALFTTQAQLNSMLPGMNQMTPQLNHLMPSQDISSNMLPSNATLTKQLMQQTIADNITANIANNILSDSQNVQPTLRQILDIPTNTENALKTLLINPSIVKDNPMVLDEANNVINEQIRLSNSAQIVSGGMETNILNPTPATAKLDALVNSTVDTHMGSPPQHNQTLTPLVINAPSNEDIMQQNSMIQQSLSPQPNPLITQSLSPQPCQPSMMQSPNIMFTVTSPCGQDIILNSQHNSNMILNQNRTSPAVLQDMGSPPSLGPGAATDGMMCQNVRNQVNDSLDNQMLNAALNITPSSINPDNLLAVSINNIMNGNINPNSTDNMHISQQHKTAPVAVKNMILNAAAEILTSQQSPITAESTINALVTSAINTATMLNENNNGPAQQSMIITQAPSVPQTDLQQQTDQQRIADALCQSNQQNCILDQHMMYANNTNSSSTCQTYTGEPVSSAIVNNVQQIINSEISAQQYSSNPQTTPQAILNNVTIPNIVENIVSQLSDNKNSATTAFITGTQFPSNQNSHTLNVGVSGQSQLLNQDICNAVNQEIQLRSAQESFLQAVRNDLVVQKTTEIVNQEIRNAVNQEIRNAVTQDSLLQAVSLVRNEMTAKNAAVVTQAMALPGKQIGQPNNFPQELTAMSDNDLISYINPSCFDQL